ncbi:MAG TPA: ABC transporter substrate-binding protein, partial [Thermomicrobiales bacterium]|nr:ABC transporter substrate-binding protein [Thermomicrobiales bacterium]
TTGGNASLLAATGFLGDIVGADRLLSGAVSTLDGIEITGDASLAITLSRPAPAFLAQLTSVTASIIDAEQVAANPDWHLNPNGSGPYRFDSWTPESTLVLQPADTWWAGKPVSGPLQYRLGASAVLPTNLYRSGDVDLVWSVPPEYVDLVEDPGSGYRWGELTEVGLFSTMYIALSNQIAPLDDLHLRRALQYAFPASDVATVMYQGTVSVATGLVPPGMNGRDWSVDYPEPDLDAARAELAQSRFGSADRVPPISIHAAGIRPVEAFRDVVSEGLGLRIEAVDVPWFDFMAGLASRRFMAHALNWNADYPDAAGMLEMLFASSSSDNGAGYANDTFDALLEEARHATGNDRLDILQEANRFLIEDVALVPLYHGVGHALVREGLSGLRVTPIGLLGLETVRGSE